MNIIELFHSYFKREHFHLCLRLNRNGKTCEKSTCEYYCNDFKITFSYIDIINDNTLSYMEIWKIGISL